MPIYETGEDLKREKEAAEYLAEKWGVVFFKKIGHDRIDFRITKNKEVIAFCEIKTRYKKFEEIERWGGFYFSFDKWKIAKLNNDVSGLPLIIVYIMEDGLYWAKFEDFEKRKVFYNGRTDREDGLEDCVLLDAKVFKKI